MKPRDILVIGEQTYIIMFIDVDIYKRVFSNKKSSYLLLLPSSINKCINDNQRTRLFNVIKYIQYIPSNVLIDIRIMYEEGVAIISFCFFCIPLIHFKPFFQLF